ncbi:MAG: YkgJ family cysteine cluster protein [Pseudomonadota bacterium]
MDKLTNLISESPFGESPVMPELLEGTTTIQFQCRKGIDCWNACCSNIDISLTPVDILRLSRRLDISTTEFLVQYTFPYELEPNGIAGVKFKPVENGSACQFMRPEGCDVYADRPTACRYYPVALLSMRRSDEYTDRNAYALVKEAHCHGHLEPRTLTIEDYRQEQGVIEYDELGRGWRQLVLKKKSSGPTIGAPSKRSLQLWFMACYDLDRFRDFIASTAFNEVYDIPWDEMQKILSTDNELMLFAFRFLRQTMFGEESIIMKTDALDKHLARKRERDATKGETPGE